MVVPAGIVAKARMIAAGLSPRGHGMFTAACSASGTGAATHYISSGLVDAGFAALLNNAAALLSNSQAGAAAQAIPMTATLADAQAVIAQSDVSMDPPHIALARLGLKLVASTP